jgi:septal ring factor EnvC (AmiA/AmiB activator)
MFVSRKKYEKDVGRLNQVIDALKGSLIQSENYNEKLTAQIRELIVDNQQMREKLRRLGYDND